VVDGQRPHRFGKDDAVAAGHGADGGDDGVRARPLEQEPGRPGSQGGEDVVVGADRGHDQDPRRVVEREDPFRRPDAVDVGHPDVHADDVGPVAADRCDCLRAVRGLPDDVMSGSDSRMARRPWRTMGSSSTRSTVSSSVTSTSPWEPRSEDPSGGYARGVELSAEHLDPLTQAVQPAPRPWDVRTDATPGLPYPNGPGSHFTKTMTEPCYILGGEVTIDDGMVRVLAARAVARVRLPSCPAD